MTYEETLEYLYNSTPLFQNVGKEAYKEGLDNTLLLDNHYGHPHKIFKTIHVAGTNGKGSCSHTLAAILQASGYKVGLYTSPHLVDFRERIRINGTQISKEYVVEFVENGKKFFEQIKPSFFELTTAMAFCWFAQEHIDIAIVEVGLGGRLDCTNIIHPELCIITNISYDHTQFLGNTLAEIAKEKAGIIKKGVPVVIGETTPETKKVFARIAEETKAPIFFAEEEKLLLADTINEEGKHIYQTEDYKDLVGELGGLYQSKNTNTILSAIRVLNSLNYSLKENNIRKGFAEVCNMTGLMGRWQKLRNKPTMICDTGHNVGGITDILRQLNQEQFNKLHIVIGMVNDKDVNGVLSMMPKDAQYYFTKASVKRALPENELKILADKHGLSGDCYPNVEYAVKAALTDAKEDDFIFIGGSNFIVADLLEKISSINSQFS